MGDLREGYCVGIAPAREDDFPCGAIQAGGIRFRSGKAALPQLVLLFGVLPVDRLDLTLLEFEAGRRFLEQSPMLSMRCWRHERIVSPCAGGVRITDNLAFAPRLARPLVALFVRWLFRHRHRVLRRRFGQVRPLPASGQ